LPKKLQNKHYLHAQTFGKTHQQDWKIDNGKLILCKNWITKSKEWGML
jgi:hypothetical protein